MENYFLELFTNFEKFFTPSYIKIINALIFIVNVLFGISIINSSSGFFGTSTTLLIIGIIWLVLSPFIARISSELILVLFKVYEAIIKNQSKSNNV